VHKRQDRVIDHMRGSGILNIEEDDMAVYSSQENCADEYLHILDENTT